MIDFVRVMMSFEEVCMNGGDELMQAGKLLSNATEILLALVPKSSIDQQVAATSLLMSLKEAGKSVRLICPHLPPSDHRIEGLDQIHTELGHQNLQIAFDYDEDKVDKISYHIGEETKKFYLTIKPKKSAQPLDFKTVNFTYTGTEADLIVTIGVTDLEELGEIYLGYEQLFKDKPLISLNEYETSFGTVKLSQAGFSSMSEVMANLIVQSGIEATTQSASNLLLGIETQTKGLQAPNASADTFQVVADLLRFGAQRRYSPSLNMAGQQRVKPSKPSSVQIASAVSTELIAAVQSISSTKPSLKKFQKPQETTVTVSRK